MRDDQVVEVGHLLHPPHRPHDELATRLIETPARQLEVLLPDAGPHLRDREPLRGQAVGIDEDIDRPLLAADQHHLPDAGERLDVLLDLLAGDLGDLAEAPPTGDGEAHHRDRVHVELLDHGRVGADRELGQDARHLVADILGGDVPRLLEDELHDDGREPLLGDAPELVDAVDRVDRLLEHLGDAGLHLLDARPLERGRHRHDREVDVGEEVEAEAPVGEETQHDERPDQHRREDGAPYEDVGEAHGRPLMLPGTRRYARPPGCRWRASRGRSSPPACRPRCRSPPRPSRRPGRPRASPRARARCRPR